MRHMRAVPSHLDMQHRLCDNIEAIQIDCCSLIPHNQSVFLAIEIIFYLTFPMTMLQQAALMLQDEVNQGSGMATASGILSYVLYTVPQFPII
jgi:hypothetical protein